ncbi:MAG: hypothetical protein E6J71_28005 [Deltaproteobacteria bacterium]|nr:MAG: hypothetical protein E6J71_28005 [Deltaproteobacteria bacterium]
MHVLVHGGKRVGLKGLPVGNVSVDSTASETESREILARLGPEITAGDRLRARSDPVTPVVAPRSLHLPAVIGRPKPGPAVPAEP